MENKTVFVTGAGSGLGKHFSKILSQQKAFVILSGRNKENLEQTALEIQDEHGKCAVFPFDVSDYENLEKKVSSAFEQFGKIDVLVNNAGVSTSVKKESWQYTFEDWDHVLNTNLKSVWFLSNLMAKKMMDLKSQGSIVNIASMVANRSRAKNPIYGISKAAVESLTKKMAFEYAPHGIRINAIAPGFFETDINRQYLQSEQGKQVILSSVPVKHVGQLSDLNGPLLLLASDASAYMTGSCLFVDGGLICNGIG